MGDSPSELVSATAYNYIKYASILDLVSTADGGMVMLGELSGNNGGFSARSTSFLKFDANGSPCWSKRSDFPGAGGTSPMDLTDTSKRVLGGW